LAVAKYRTTIEPAPTYDQNCTLAQESESVQYNHASLNWDKIIVISSLTDIPFNFASNSSTKHNSNVGKYHNEFAVIPNHVPVETEASSRTKK
jgi:hypothetical protein